VCSGGGIDLGLRGRLALICGSSAGLGLACAEALAAAGADVVMNGRTESRLAAAARSVAARTEAHVTWVVADVTTADGRQQLLTECPSPDVLVNNAAGPPPGDFREFDEADWAQALEATMVAPIMLIKAVIDGMATRRWGRIINITSSAVKAPLPLLGLSNGARSGLTGFVAGLAREIADQGVTINNLLPGRMETDRLRGYVQAIAEANDISVEAARAELIATNPMKRFGRPDELGVFCAFLASVPGAYITGQNFLIDGGEFPG
jgi:3-oxoacyl-[acyl-carrier protein] reductase